LGLRLILDSTWGHDYENPLSPVQNPHQIKASSNGITLFWTAVPPCKKIRHLREGLDVLDSSPC
ncbi:MAG: hypothetical protein ACYC2E_13245, partial [Sulfuricella sp.]